MISDETLILYYGDELDERERTQIAQALDRDTTLADRYARLVEDLERLRTAPLPAPPPGAVSGWHRALERVAAPTAAPQRRTFWAPALAMAAGVAVLAIGIQIGVRMAPAPEPAATVASPTPPPVVTPQVVPTAFSRGLATYMQTARADLVELDPADAAARTAVIAEIIAHNRAFERAAEERGAPDIARVLRAFEQVLHQLADETANPDDLRHDIDRLSFEYSAMLTRIAPHASNEPYTL